MFNPKTLFALNKKDQDAIVFTDANGGIIRLTSADFKSEDTFRRWKSWYMKRLNEEENENHTYADNTLSLDGLPEALTATPSPEIVIERRVERKKENTDDPSLQLHTGVTEFGLLDASQAHNWEMRC